MLSLRIAHRLKEYIRLKLALVGQMRYLNGFAGNISMEPDTLQLPCADKLVFETRQEALGASVTAKWQYGTKLKPYKCQYCDLWHLASHYEAS